MKETEKWSESVKEKKRQNWQKKKKREGEKIKDKKRMKET